MGTTKVEFDTSKGLIVIELNSDKAPKTVANFIKYVEAGHYDGLIFHRVIPGFMVQGGGMDASMSERAAPHRVDNEADNGLKNIVGSVAMARTQDPHSAGAQFFINVKDNVFLDHSGKTMQGWGYAVFGQVISGLDVVKAIEGVETGRSGYHSDVPKTPIVIHSAKIAE